MVLILNIRKVYFGRLSYYAVENFPCAVEDTWRWHFPYYLLFLIWILDLGRIEGNPSLVYFIIFLGRPGLLVFPPHPHPRRPHPQQGEAGLRQ